MTDPQLFDQPSRYPIQNVHGLARYGGPATSFEAAQKITGRTEQRILKIFGGPARQLTDEELTVIAKDVYGPTLISARSRLSRKGVLVDSGERRLSSRGAAQIVWRLRGDETS